MPWSTIHINRWDVTRILIDKGSQTKILFLSVFKKMGYDKKPLYGFGGKRIELVGVTTLPISFGTQQNPRIEYMTFVVVDMLCPYNAIFERGLLNTLEATLHSRYLYLKVLATFDIKTVFGSQQEARNIERGFTLGHKNMHFLREDTKQHE
jgi:hypothetical protein